MFEIRGYFHPEIDIQTERLCTTYQSEFHANFKSAHRIIFDCVFFEILGTFRKNFALGKNIVIKGNITGSLVPHKFYRDLINNFFLKEY
jgi:hypothetical protein